MNKFVSGVMNVSYINILNALFFDDFYINNCTIVKL